MKVFLGGTVNSNWREKAIEFLQIDYYNPIVLNWTPRCKLKEDEEKASSDFLLYVITPNMEGAYSIAEVIDDSNKRPEKVIFCMLLDDKDEYGNKTSFSDNQHKSMLLIYKMIEKNGAKAFISLEGAINYINKRGRLNGN